MKKIGSISLTPFGHEVWDGVKWVKMPCVVGNVTYVKKETPKN